MEVVLEIEKERAKFAKRKKRYRFLLIFSLALFLLGATLMVVLSPDEYSTLQWVLIILATLYIWGFIYFISVPYKMVKQYDAFYRSYSRGIIEHEKLTITDFDSKIKIDKSGLEVCTLKTTCKDKNIVFDRDVYVTDEKLSLPKGTIIKARLFRNVLLDYEVSE
ncbi:MAG: hypothetical protein WC282_03650 [Bacilli bacterium]|jgi:hypothetical protein